ncbi:MAG: sensor histidine kinase [Planctomycetaceae bacterium]
MDSSWQWLESNLEAFLPGDPTTDEFREFVECLEYLLFQMFRRKGYQVSVVEGQLSRGAFQLSPSHGELTADFDEQLLRKAIEELIQNARKAVGETHLLKMSASVSALNRRGVPWCRIDLRDNGPGIPKENLKRIFEDFFTEWSHPEIKGSGLGLSYGQSVVSVHGGTIIAVECESGACFRIEFPRYDRTPHQKLISPESGWSERGS